MKRMKRLLVALTAFMLCIVPVLSTPITAKAASEPVTYYLKYKEDMNAWRYQVGTWNDSNGTGRDLYYMQLDIKDGDLIVIDGTSDLKLDVNAHLSNLTVVHSPNANVTAKGYDNVFVINDSVAVINGDVTNAYVYDYTLSNFNNNVSYLEIVSSKEEFLKSTVAVAGTVDHVKAYGKAYTHFELYSFPANTLYVEEGNLKTDASNFSKTPVAATPAPATPAPTTEVVTPAPEVVTPAPETVTPVAPSDEYDEVPKTADIRFNPLWLVSIAAVCLAGSYALKKED